MYLLRELMDDIKYRRDNGRNIVTVTVMKEG